MIVMVVPRMRADDLHVGRMHAVVGARERQHSWRNSMLRHEEPRSFVPFGYEPRPAGKPEVLSGVKVDRGAGLDDENRLRRDDDRWRLRTSDVDVLERVRPTCRPDTVVTLRSRA